MTKERKYTSLALSVFIFLLFSTLVLAIFAKAINQDEGVFLTIGRGLLRGQLPYRDFFDHKPPGIYLFFALFPSILLVKFIFVFVYLLSAILIAKIVKKIGGHVLVAVVSFLFLAILFEGNYTIAEPIVSLLLLIAFWILIRPGKPINALFLAGLITGFAILFKQTAILSALALFLSLAFFSKRKTSSIVFLAGVFMVGILTLLSLALAKIIPDGWHQIIAVNLTNYPRESFIVVIKYLFRPFLIALPVFIIALLTIKKLPPRYKFILLSIIILPIPALLFRHYPHYWLQILPFVAVVASFYFNRLSISRPFLRIALIFLFFVCAGSWFNSYSNIRLLSEQTEVAEKVKRLPENYLLAENQFTAFYFLTEKKPLNRYLYITEINDWSEDAEKKSIADLENNPDAIILWPRDHNYAYAKNLQRYISENYLPIGQFPRLGLVVYRTK